MIEIKNLVKRYGSFTAVDNLSFTLEQGNIYGFLGPNGAGKSTTMNMITGYISATEGHVYIDGHDIFLEPEKAKRCIGYLPELPPIYPDMTTSEYLAFAAQLKGLARKKVALEVERVMDATGISQMRNRLIKHLSKGYRQRVGISCALLGNPSIIILDEPTVGLDPKQIIDIRNLIRSLAGKHTVILSSHILSEINAICDYVFIISKGKLVASDTPKQLSKLMQHSNRYHLLVQKDSDTLQTALSALQGLHSLSISSDESGFSAVTLETGADIDPREELFYLLAEAKAPIMQLTSHTVSLEHVFLELTNQKSDSVPIDSLSLENTEDKANVSYL